MSLNCMIVDDQNESVDLILDHIAKVSFLTAQYSTVFPHEALAYLDNHKVDCIFLDVEMPDLTGLEFIETLISKVGLDIPKIILITAYDRYALSGYEYGVVDYLLKPISFKRFKICADRLWADNNRSIQTDFIFIEVDGRKQRLNYDDICYAEGAGNYVNIYTPEKKFITYSTLSGILDQLPQSKFMRIHKSFVIAIERVTVVKGNEVEISLALNKNQTLPIGASYRENLKRVLKII